MGKLIMAHCRPVDSAADLGQLINGSLVRIIPAAGKQPIWMVYSGSNKGKEPREHYEGRHTFIEIPKDYRGESKTINIWEEKEQNMQFARGIIQFGKQPTYYFVATASDGYASLKQILDRAHRL